MSEAARTWEHPERRTVTLFGQLLALMLSLLWGVAPGFGLIDLEAAIPPGNPDFRAHWFLEGSWGMYITALVVVPLLVAVVAPHRAPDTVTQLHVLAGCGVAAAALCLDFSLLLLPMALEATAWAVWALLREPVSSAPHDRDAASGRWLAVVAGSYFGVALMFGADALTGRVVGILAGILALVAWLAWSPTAVLRRDRAARRRWPLLVVTLAAAAGWVTYAVIMAADFWSGARYTGMVDRVSAQAAFALALGCLLLGSGLDRLPLRLCVWTASVAGVGVGSFAILNPTEQASPGGAWGTMAVISSVATLVVAEVTVRRRVGHATGPRQPAS